MKVITFALGMKKAVFGFFIFFGFMQSVQSNDLSDCRVNNSQDNVHCICDEFRLLLDAPQSLNIERYALESSIPIGGHEGGARYFNVDIDGDDINDQVVVNCSASDMEADPCGLWLELSSGKKIEFTEDRFYLIRHDSKIYVLVNHIGGQKNIGKRKIYRANEFGVTLICHKL